MLSDEERQAIEYLKRHIIPYYGRKGAIEFMLNDTLLNLIEKQSKEIEELKDKYSDEKIRSTVIKRYKEVIEKDYISKDKIKAKIEELEKQDKESKLSHNYLVIPVLQSLLEKE